MSKRCCKYHDKLAFVETDLTKCAMAGMGRPTVCCVSCPDNHYAAGFAYYYDTEPEMAEDRAEWEQLYA